MQEEINTALSELSNKVPNLSYIKEVKSGKEATVHLVTNGLSLYALKIYRQNTKFSTKLQYLELNKVADSRTQRAIKNRSKAGTASLENIWINKEFWLMKELHEYSTNIPEVFACTSSAILLEYLGTEKSPAPKLSDISLNKQDSEFCFEEIIQNINLFLDFGFVHGDLSEYNILWWNNQPYVIDFPQTLDIKTNKNAYERFNKDLENIEKYFSKSIEPYLLRKSFKQLKDKFSAIRIYG